MGASKIIFEPMIRLAQIMHLSYANTNIIPNNQNEIPQDARYLGLLPGASKTISEPMVHLAQTMHLSCTDTNTISKWTETRFDITHVT
jgi:hypothetical protein